VHFAFGGFALLIEPWGRGACAAIAGAAVLYNAVLAPRFGLDRAYRRPDERILSGLVTYPLAVLLLLLLAPPAVAAGAWVVLASVDPVAAAAGSRFAAPRVPWQKAKSLTGTLAGFLAGSLLCGGMLRLLGEDAWPAAVAAAASGAAAETLPLPIDDNLPIAAAAAIPLALLLG
jgi:dolichol kinase